jgi:hypothetical protein
MLEPLEPCSHILWDWPLVVYRNVTRPILTGKRTPVIRHEARGFTD